MGENSCKWSGQQGIAALCQKSRQPKPKMGKDLNRHFSKEDIQMVKKHMKRCSKSLLIREMQTKTTVRYHLIPMRKVIIKNSQTINSGEGVEKMGSSYTVDRNVNWYNHYGEQYAAAAKSLQSCPTLCDPIDGSPPGSPVPGILQAGTLEWVAISLSNAWKWQLKVKSLSRVQPSATPWRTVWKFLKKLKIELPCDPVILLLGIYPQKTN